MVMDPRAQFEDLKDEARFSMQGLARLNPEKLDFYIDYLKFQVEHGFYDSDANLNILKLFQFSPDLITRTSIDTVHLILIKALMQLPTPDYVFCRAQLSQDMLENDITKKIDEVSTMLETCQFVQFWNTIATEKMFSEMTGFIDSAKAFICHVVGLTYKNIEASFLQQMLGPLSENEFSGLLVTMGWVISEDGSSVFVGHKEEMVESKEIVEKMPIDIVSPILAIR